MVLSMMISGLKNSQTVGQWDSKMGQFLVPKRRQLGEWPD